MISIFQNKIVLIIASILLQILCHARYGFSQNSKADDVFSVLSFGIHYGASFPAADLADRFGYMNNVGGKFEYLSKENWYYRLSGNYHFGTTVNEDVLANLRTSVGGVIGNNKMYADLFMRGRLYHFSLGVGKLFPWNKKSKSGILVNLGGGFVSHKVRVQDDSQSVPQVLDFNLPGYDRLTAGWLLQQQFGYYSNNALSGGIKFYILAELNQGFTEGLRTFNYSTNESDKGVQRLDLLLGLKAGILLPLSTRGSAQEIYY